MEAENNSSPNAGANARAILIVLRVGAALFFCSLTAGYLVGRARSPVYNDPTKSPPFIRVVVRTLAKKSADAGWFIEKYPDGRLRSFRLNGVRLAFTCGVETTSYDSVTKEITKRPTPPAGQHQPIPTLGLGYNETLGFLLGGSQAYTIAYAAKEVKKSFTVLVATARRTQKLALITGGFVLTGTGYGVGHHFGFDDSVRCGEQLFANLLSSRTFWEGVAADFIADHYWILEYRDQWHGRDLEWSDLPGWARNRLSADDWKAERAIRDLNFIRVRLESWHPVSYREYKAESELAGVPYAEEYDPSLLLPHLGFSKSWSESYIRRLFLSPVSAALMRAPDCPSQGHCLPEDLRRLLSKPR